VKDSDSRESRATVEFCGWASQSGRPFRQQKSKTLEKFLQVPHVMWGVEEKKKENVEEEKTRGRSEGFGPPQKKNRMCSDCARKMWQEAIGSPAHEKQRRSGEIPSRRRDTTGSVRKRPAAARGGGTAQRRGGWAKGGWGAIRLIAKKAVLMDLIKEGIGEGKGVRGSKGAP